MNRLRWQILIAMLVVFVAGTVIGFVSRVEADAPQRDPDRGSWLISELNLTKEQSEQMREIWSGVMSAGKQSREQREAILAEHESNLRALLTPEQQQRYDELRAEMRAKLAQLDEQRRAAFTAAVERSKQILTDEQRARYEQLLRDRPDHGRRGRFGDGPGRDGRDGSGPRSTTRPTENQTEQTERLTS
jgi:Spy/CpxP family protein refolding chaperone